MWGWYCKCRGNCKLVGFSSYQRKELLLLEWCSEEQEVAWKTRKGQQEAGEGGGREASPFFLLPFSLLLASPAGRASCGQLTKLKCGPSVQRSPAPASQSQYRTEGGLGADSDPVTAAVSPLTLSICMRVAGSNGWWAVRVPFCPPDYWKPLLQMKALSSICMQQKCLYTVETFWEAHHVLLSPDLFVSIFPSCPSWAPDHPAQMLASACESLQIHTCDMFQSRQVDYQMCGSKLCSLGELPSMNGLRGHLSSGLSWCNCPPLLGAGILGRTICKPVLGFSSSISPWQETLKRPSMWIEGEEESLLTVSSCNKLHSCKDFIPNHILNNCINSSPKYKYCSYT